MLCAKITPFAVVLLSILCGVSSAAPLDAKKLFDDLYGRRVDAANRSLSRDDDVQLAAELLRVAKESDVQPALLELLCEQAYELGMKSKGGYGTAVESMRLLAASSEAKRTEAQTNMLDALNRQYLGSTGDERNTLGNALIDEYLQAGDAQMKAGDASAALTHYRKAALLAGRMRSPKSADAKARMESAVQRQRTERNIERLEQKLLRDANDTTSAKVLTMIYITERDDPGKAAKWAPRSGDDELKTMVPLAAKPFVQLDPKEKLKLGEWYKSLADAVPMQSRDIPLQKAHTYLSIVVESGQVTGIELTKAKLLLEATDKAVVARTPKITPGSRVGHNAFFDLDTAKVAFGLGDRWSVEDGVLSGNLGNIDITNPQTKVPVKARTLRYGFKIKAKWYQAAFVKFSNRGGARFFMSVGHWNNSKTSINIVGRHYRVPARVTNPDDWHQMEIRLEPTHATFHYDGKELYKSIFQDPIGDPEGFTIGFGTHETAIQIKDMYLIIDGRPARRLPVRK